MIVWINGAFGAGKTSVARALRKNVPDTLLYDPEFLGVLLQRLTPRRWRRDFQDLALWRAGTCWAIRGLSLVRRHIVVPMTVVERVVFDGTIGRLQRSTDDLQHIMLLATPQTLRRRLDARGGESNAWSVGQIERCSSGLAHLPATHRIATDDVALAGVVSAVQKAVGLCEG